MIAKFQSLTRINEGLIDSLQSPLENLLLDACAEENFTKPFESDGQKRTFRARLIDEKHPDFRDDIEGKSPGEEQAYRRGYDQGFACARDMVRAKKSLTEILEEEKLIHAWRTARVQIIGTRPGGTESYSIGLNFRRTGISLTLRYEVFKRDGFKCCYCGLSASNGATLEIDHKIPVSAGGTNNRDNLQTLCFECNRGKSDSHED